MEERGRGGGPERGVSICCYLAFVTRPLTTHIFDPVRSTPPPVHDTPLRAHALQTAGNIMSYPFSVRLTSVSNIFRCQVPSIQNTRVLVILALIKFLFSLLLGLNFFFLFFWFFERPQLKRTGGRQKCPPVPLKKKKKRKKSVKKVYS